MDIDVIESKLDRVQAGATEVSMRLGGIQIKSMSEVFDLSKLVSISGVAVPPHLRGNPGACLAVCLTALRFDFDPYQLAAHSFTMKKSQKVGNNWEDVETLAYDSFVIRAIIDAHAKLTGRIRYEFRGEGDDRVCIASAIPPGEKSPLIVESPPIGKIREARGFNDKGNFKGSPQWINNPDQQQSYSTGRDLCRRYFPAVLMGYYDKDELVESSIPQVSEIPRPGLKDRLMKNRPNEQQRGFSHEGISSVIEGEITRSADEQSSTNDGAILPASSAVPDDSTSSPVASGTAPTSPELPPPPKDGKDYPEYAKAMMATLPTPEAIAAWWKSKNERSLRNSLANLGQPELTLIDESRASRLAEIQPK